MPPPSFALVLEPTESGARRLGGLALALRLALDAQAAGAACIVVPETASDLRALLSDPRLRLPVVSKSPAGLPRLRAPASLLVHRATLRELSQKLAAGPSLDGRSDEHELLVASEAGGAPHVAYAFAPIDVTTAAAAK